MIDILISVMHDTNFVYFAIFGTIFSSGYIFKFYRTEAHDERGERILGRAFKNAHYILLSLPVIQIFLRDWIISSEVIYINSIVLSLLIIDVVTAISIYYFSKNM